jgi:hypothetical protein
MMPKCCTCEKPLSTHEMERYYDDCARFRQRHPNCALDFNNMPMGVFRNCDQCKVERLKGQVERLEDETTVERLAAGKGCALLLIVLGAMLSWTMA